jgi:hypothetical protein
LSSHLLSKNLKTAIYETIILTVVLYGCETWSLTLRDGHRLTVFENRVLRRTFGPKRDEETGGWRKLHNEKLHNLYFWPSVACMGEKRNAYGILVGNPEGKRLLGRPRRRWEHNIRMGLRDRMGGMDWIHLAQDRDQQRAVVNTVMNLRAP